MFVAALIKPTEGKNSAGNTTFATNYGRWLEKHNSLICEIRSSLNEEVVDDKLVFLIDIVMKHYVEFSEMKTSAANFDVSNVAWNTTAEHSVWWIGGFRPSQLLQVMLVYALAWNQNEERKKKISKILMLHGVCSGNRLLCLNFNIRVLSSNFLIFGILYNHVNK